MIEVNEVLDLLIILMLSVVIVDVGIRGPELVFKADMMLVCIVLV